jgi:hypothetical protein
MKIERPLTVHLARRAAALRLVSTLLVAAGAAPVTAQSCEVVWHKAALTTYTSYPAPGSEECLAYNGCTWAGQFYGVEGTQSKEWVARHNIAAVHEDDWDWLGMKVLNLRQGGREIKVQVIDICADADCGGCCTANLGGDGFLIDLESATMARFGAGDGVVEFQVCAPASDD